MFQDYCGAGAVQGCAGDDVVYCEGRGGPGCGAGGGKCGEGEDDDDTDGVFGEDEGEEGAGGAWVVEGVEGWILGTGGRVGGGCYGGWGWGVLGWGVFMISFFCAVCVRGVVKQVGRWMDGKWRCARKIKYGRFFGCVFA